MDRQEQVFSFGQLAVNHSNNDHGLGGNRFGTRITWFPLADPDNDNQGSFDTVIPSLKALDCDYGSMKTFFQT